MSAVREGRMRGLCVVVLSCLFPLFMSVGVCVSHL